MAKDNLSDEEVWENWRKSPYPELRKAADNYMPVLSIRDEFDAAIESGDIQRVIYIGKTIDKYTNPEKGTFTNNERAFNALQEIRAYTPK